MDKIINLSMKIKQRREQLNFSQKDLAELTNISERTIRSIENAESSTSISSWYNILDVLGLEMKITFKKISNEEGDSLL